MAIADGIEHCIDLIRVCSVIHHAADKEEWEDLEIDQSDSRWRGDRFPANIGTWDDSEYGSVTERQVSAFRK